FCQNNQWAISEPIEKQTRIPLYQRANGFGFPGIRVDGNDVLAVYAVTQEALRNAREGNGPTLIEAYTYRMGAHTTSDDPTRYRIASEVEAWQQKEPIERLGSDLLRPAPAAPALPAETARYAIASEVEAGQQKDPIERLRSYLLATDQADQAFLDEIEAESDQIAAELR